MDSHASPSDATNPVETTVMADVCDLSSSNARLLKSSVTSVQLTMESEWIKYRGAASMRSMRTGVLLKCAEEMSITRRLLDKVDTSYVSLRPVTTEVFLSCAEEMSITRRKLDKVDTSYASMRPVTTGVLLTCAEEMSITKRLLEK